MLLDCPECGKRISFQAKRCPRCGMPDAGQIAYWATDEYRKWAAEEAKKNQKRIQMEREAKERGYRAEQREEAIKNFLVVVFWLIVAAVGVAIWYALTH